MPYKRRNDHTGGPRIPGRLLAGLVAAGLLILVAAANGHLVYVAVTTEPDCVAHVEAGNDAPGTYSAAKSAC